MTALRHPRSIALFTFAAFAWVLWAGEMSRSAAAERGASASTLKTSVPQQIGLWRGTPVPVEQRAVEILETDDVALMEYRLGEELPVWFAQVAGFGNRAAFHPPELCYVGSHFEVLQRGQISVTVNGSQRQLMRLVIRQGTEQFEAWYWFTANGRVTPNYYQQQAWLLLDGIKRQPISGTLVRISTPLNDSAATHRRLLAFVTALESVQNAAPAHGA